MESTACPEKPPNIYTAHNLQSAKTVHFTVAGSVAHTHFVSRNTPFLRSESPSSTALFLALRPIPRHFSRWLASLCDDTFVWQCGHEMRSSAVADTAGSLQLCEHVKQSRDDSTADACSLKTTCIVSANRMSWKASSANKSFMQNTAKTTNH